MGLVTRLDKKLAGQPSEFLTILLIGLAAAIVTIALIGSPTMKAAVAAWVILP